MFGDHSTRPDVGPPIATLAVFLTIRHSNDVRDESILEAALVSRATARLAKVCEIALRGVELSLPQYRLLTYLAEGSAAAAALAERLIVSRPSVTTLVDGLVDRGLVERQPDRVDRRRVDHLLTSSGHEALSRADAAVADMLHELIGRLGPADARRALEGLALVHQALELALAERELGDQAEEPQTARPVASS